MPAFISVVVVKKSRRDDMSVEKMVIAIKSRRDDMSISEIEN
jgi:hypothetical protein